MSREEVQKKLQTIEQLELTASKAAATATDKQNTIDQQFKEMKQTEERLSKEKLELEQKRSGLQEEIRMLKSQLENELQAERFEQFSVPSNALG